jgi:hypothetical protein
MKTMLTLTKVGNVDLIINTLYRDTVQYQSLLYRQQIECS